MPVDPEQTTDRTNKSCALTEMKVSEGGVAYFRESAIRRLEQWLARWRMWLRILSMTAGSVISAMTRSVPPHSGQTVTVEADRNCDRTKARLSGALHDVVPRRVLLRPHTVAAFRNLAFPDHGKLRPETAIQSPTFSRVDNLA